MSTTRARLAQLIVLFVALALLPGCQMLLELLGESSEGESESTVCTEAETCCTELMQATAYDEVAERAEQRGWPNHCPSWNARSQQECTAFLEAVTEQKETVIKEHPVFEAENCP